MKFVATTLLILACSSTMFAQYKKASFFEKSGRTYGLGLQMYALGDGKGTVPGLNLSFGRDQDGKRLFSFWELRLIPSFKFKFETLDLDAEPVTVTGKSRMSLIYAMNYGWHILNPDVTERKFHPYLTAGFNIVIVGGMKKLDDESWEENTIKKVPSRNFSTGIGGGLGSIIDLHGNWSLKIEGGYTWQGNVSSEFQDNEDEYFMFTNHPYASAGIRFRIESD
jgi:hypothetical protein